MKKRTVIRNAISFQGLFFAWQLCKISCSFQILQNRFSDYSRVLSGMYNKNTNLIISNETKHKMLGNNSLACCVLLKLQHWDPACLSDCYKEELLSLNYIILHENWPQLPYTKYRLYTWRLRHTHWKQHDGACAEESRVQGRLLKVLEWKVIDLNTVLSQLNTTTLPQHAWNEWIMRGTLHSSLRVWSPIRKLFQAINFVLQIRDILPYVCMVFFSLNA